MFFPLSRAEHRRWGREKRVGLFERSEFRHAPTPSTTRRKKRDTGVFFWFVFFHAEENEQSLLVIKIDRYKHLPHRTRAPRSTRFDQLLQRFKAGLKYPNFTSGNRRRIFFSNRGTPIGPPLGAASRISR